MIATHWCGDCSADREFTTFECGDHDADCIELVCVECGAGIEVGATLLVLATVEVPLRRAS
jgi:hypothetical protein